MVNHRIVLHFSAPHVMQHNIYFKKKSPGFGGYFIFHTLYNGNGAEALCLTYSFSNIIGEKTRLFKRICPLIALQETSSYEHLNFNQ